jgi:hypothetical protein
MAILSVRVSPRRVIVLHKLVISEKLNYMNEGQKTGTGGSRRKTVGNNLLFYGIICFVISLIPFSVGGWNRNGDIESLGYNLAYFVGSLGIWISIPMIVVGLDCRATRRKYIVAFGCVILGSICAIVSHYLGVHYMSYFGVILSLLAVLFAAESRPQLKVGASSTDRGMATVSLILGIIVCICSFLTTSFGPWS